MRRAVVASLLLAGLFGRALTSEEAVCAQGSLCSSSALDTAIRHDMSEGVSLLAVRSQKSKRSQQRVECTSLENHETHFTVDVALGTPAQIFALVADTGSNSLIVASCACMEAGSCDKESHCFTGTDKSTTFHADPEEPELVLTFGSGQIQAEEAVDVCQVAGVTANMTDGILLMTDQALDFGGPFEGILGLGPPLPKEEEMEEEMAAEDDMAGLSDAEMDDILDKAFGDGSSGGVADTAADSQRMAERRMAARRIARKARSARSSRARGRGRSRRRGGRSAHQPLGFLEQAHVQRFSMCFNDGAAGVLRLDTPAAPQAHASVGTEHWGLGLEGISVGDDPSMVRALPASDSAQDPELGFPLGDGAGARLVSAPSGGTSALCSKDNMKEGQTTPCGAIPDSGTTMIVGPKGHTNALLEAICDGWPRCRQNYTALVSAVEEAKKVITKEYNTNPFEFSVSSKADVLDMVLTDCAVWLKDGDLDELPAIHFYLTGKGSQQKVTIPARTWVIDSMVEEKENTYMHIDGLGDVPVGTNGTGKMVRTCMHSFDEMDYQTIENGPVWILGTPLFYEYTVGYDMKEKTVSLTSQKEEPCGACDGKTGLIASRAEATGKKRAPRRQLGTPRRPSFDVSRPL